MEKTKKVKSMVVSKVDELGRIQVPYKTRKNLKIKTGDKLAICESGKNIIIKKVDTNIFKKEIKRTNFMLDDGIEINIQVSKTRNDYEKNTNNKTIIRTIDEFGKVVIPITTRQNLNINNEDTLKLCIKDDMLVLIKIGI